MDFQRILDIVNTLKTDATLDTVAQSGQIPVGVIQCAVHMTNIAMRNGVQMSGKPNSFS